MYKKMPPDLFTLLISEIQANLLPNVLNGLVFILPIAVPFFLTLVFWEKWVDFVQTRFIASQEYVVLDIKVPKESVRSPAAMELFFHSLFLTSGEGSWIDRFWYGKVRPWFSLELISIEGQFHFCIWTRKNLVRTIENSLYSQFPSIEVHEIPDYAKSVSFDKDRDVMTAFEMKLTKADPYPIKTYIDYGLDKDPKEEFKIDPITPVIEFLGSIGVNQQVWIQIIIRAHSKNDTIAGGMFFKNEDPFKKEAEKIINEIKHRDPKTRLPIKIKDPDQAGFMGIVSLTKGEEETIAAIERATQKLQFDTAIRMIYIAKKENFDSTNIGALLGSFKQYGSETLNGFKLNTDVYNPRYDMPWQDFRGIRKNADLQRALDAYKKRAVFYSHGLRSKIFHLNTEELATIFHFPGQVSQTPSYERIPSKKSEPPANLPV